MSPATIAAPATGPTGPRTEEGKKKSALNALRHGLTGRVVVMPWEDMDAYMRFCAELMTDLAPETPVERQFAQTFCDTQWRLNRMRSIEDCILALGHSEEAGQIETEHPQVHAALTAARVYRDDSQTFANLSLYDQRLQRTLDKSLKQLKALQAERKALAHVKAEAKAEVKPEVKAKAEAEAPSAHQQGAETVAEVHTQAPAEDPAEAPAQQQFVFSTAEIGLEIPTAHPANVQRCGPGAANATHFAPGLAA